MEKRILLTEMRCIVERNVFCVNRDVIDCCCYKNAPLMSKNILREQNKTLEISKIIL